MKISITERAGRYISQMPPSIQGSGGSNALFDVALALTKGFNLPEVLAFPILAEWNQSNAIPQWSDAELLHKLRDASKAAVPGGYLLNDDAPHQGSRRTPQSYLDASRIALVDEERRKGEKARKRALWPAFKRPTDEEVALVARLRNLPVEAVDLARAARLLWSARVDDVDCFVISESDHFAQAMRYDGKPFAMPGAPKKKQLPGSLSKGFIGWTTQGSTECPVLLVEGVVGLLEGIAAARAVDADSRPGAGWGVLAAISCHSRFADETFPLPDLTGRRYRILPDHDEGLAGFEAAAAWQYELRARGASADAYPLPDGCKDLGPVIAHAEAHLDYLHQLFAI
jgi:hypothetical protein